MAQSAGDRQDQYNQLMSEGEKLPGVAEAMAVYEAAREVAALVPVVGFQSRSTTGGNA